MKFIYSIIILLVFKITVLYANICNVENSDKLDFGKMVIRDTEERDLTIFNAGNDILKIENIILNSAFDGFIEFEPPAFPVNIKQNEGFILPLRLNAKQNINFRAMVFVQVSCGDAKYSIPVSVSANITASKDGSTHLTDNRWGRELIDAMFLSMNNHTVFSYRDARILFWSSFDRKDGLVECIYTGKTIDPGDNPDFAQLDGTGFNTEHTWPRSVGADTEPPLSDINHLFVTDKTTNDRRANFSFGFITGNPTYENGGSKLGKNDKGATVFEVREKTRGNIARAMLYFAVRYNNPNNYLDSQEETLRIWAAQDPVDDDEAARNDSVAKYQSRSNLFIEVPELLERIPSISKRANIEFVPNYFVSDSEIIFDLTKFSATATSKFFITNFSNHSDSSISIDNIIYNGNENDFAVNFDENSMSIKPGSYKEIEVICYNNNNLTNADITINFRSGKSHNVALKAVNLGMSVKNLLLNQNYRITNYPNPANDRTQILLENIEKNMVKSAKIYNLMSVEMYDLTSKIANDGNNLRIDFIPENLSNTSQVFFIRLELNSGYSIVYPLIFSN